MFSQLLVMSSCLFPTIPPVPEGEQSDLINPGRAAELASACWQQFLLLWGSAFPFLRPMQGSSPDLPAAVLLAGMQGKQEMEVLNDKVVLISGAGSGLGSQLALAAVRSGAQVAVCARSQASLDQVALRLKREASDADWQGCIADITDIGACQHFIDRAMEQYGRVDALINNAFQPIPAAAIEEADIRDWRAAMEVNFFGTVQLTRCAIPALKQSLSGAIVMINSMNTRHYTGDRAGVAASKAALLTVTQYLARELGEHNIRVNSALMGWMWGPAVEGHFKRTAEATGIPAAQLRADVERGFALGKMPADSDCAQAAIFLASDYAAAITGACLDVNGGAFIDH